MKTRIVVVTWSDASVQSDEAGIGELPALVTARTFGVLVKQTDEAVWIAAEKLFDPIKNSVTYRGTTVIPAGMVQKVKILGYEDP